MSFNVGGEVLTLENTNMSFNAGKDLHMAINSEIRIGLSHASYNHRIYAPATSITYFIGDQTLFFGRDNTLELMRITPGVTTRGGAKFINVGYQADDMGGSSTVTLDDGTYHYKTATGNITFVFGEFFWTGTDQVMQFWLELDNTAARNHTWPGTVEWDTRTDHGKAAADDAGKHLIYFVNRTTAGANQNWIATVIAHDVA
jgi:hypothetical protein